MVWRIKSTIPYLKPSQIEDEANTLLDDYQSSEGEIEEPPVKVEFIAEFMGYELVAETLDDETLAFVDPNKKIICTNLTRSDYFDKVGFEFTVAHEIGHVRLGHFETAQPKLIPEPENQPTRFLHRENTKQTYYRHERQAERFAACLLMPKALLLRETRKYDLLHWQSIARLGKVFTVSKTAMRIRLETLSLIYCKGQKIYRSKEEAMGQRRLI